jgi:mono/diheme cytochrome c family protein
VHVSERSPLIALAGLTVIAACMIRPGPSVTAGSSAVERGRELFANKGCAYCHGPAGVGGRVGPDLQLVRKRLDTEAISRQIHLGGKAMPAFGGQLTEQEISDLVAFLRAKRKVVVAPAKPLSPVTHSSPQPEQN